MYGLESIACKGKLIQRGSDTSFDLFYA